jgi:hypothetical protein
MGKLLEDAIERSRRSRRLKIRLNEVVLALRHVPSLEVVSNVVPIPDPARRYALEKLKLFLPVPPLPENRRAWRVDKVELVVEAMRILRKGDSQAWKALSEKTATHAPDMDVATKIAATR